MPDTHEHVFSGGKSLLHEVEHYSFPWIVPLTLDPYLIMLGVKQGGIKYHFKSLWHNSTRDWILFSRAIGEHSTNKEYIYIYIYIYIHIYIYHHYVVLPARISLTLSRHSSLSFIASGRSSGLHPVSSQSWSSYMWGSIGVHHFCFSNSVPHVWFV